MFLGLGKGLGLGLDNEVRVRVWVRVRVRVRVRVNVSLSERHVHAHERRGLGLGLASQENIALLRLSFKPLSVYGHRGPCTCIGIFINVGIRFLHGASLEFARLSVHYRSSESSLFPRVIIFDERCDRFVRQHLPGSFDMNDIY